MKRKFAAFGATLLLVLAVVGFSGGGVPKPDVQPAQAWYYSYCTPTGMNGYRYCYRVCGAMEKYWTPNCNQYVYVNQWNA